MKIMTIGVLNSRNQVESVFSNGRLSKEELKAIVDKYMGDSPVPPRWTASGVKGEFGRKIFRLWSRKLKNRHHAAYRSEESGRWLHPAVQSIHDFDASTIDRAKEIYGLN